MHQDYRLKKEIKDGPDSANEERINQENIIRKMLSQNKVQAFLEIGIGSFPHIERLKFMSEHGISYTGCDFQLVCDNHENIIEKQADFKPDKIRFLPNQVGTYAWNLFELLKKNEQFDVIYLDGHHTFYVDFPALMLAHYLLKEDGYLIIDDISWTLRFMKNQLMNSFSGWLFYRKIYNFSDYERAQQDIPHMDMMTRTILIGKEKYLKIEECSTSSWWVLKKSVLK